MKISKSARRNAKQLFRCCVTDGALDEGRVREVVRKMGELRPRGCMPILSHFRRLVKLELDRRTARVDSAVPLTPELTAKITNELNQTYGRGLNILVAQDPGLVGGLRIKVGSEVYDGSIQGRLRKLAETF
jgi:F-type H+-transporting ATPase subunit delta